MVRRRKEPGSSESCRLVGKRRQANRQRRPETTGRGSALVSLKSRKRSCQCTPTHTHTHSPPQPCPRRREPRSGTFPATAPSPPQCHHPPVKRCGTWEARSRLIRSGRAHVQRHLEFNREGAEHPLRLQRRGVLGPLRRGQGATVLPPSKHPQLLFKMSLAVRLKTSPPGHTKDLNLDFKAQRGTNLKTLSCCLSFFPFKGKTQDKTQKRSLPDLPR